MFKNFFNNSLILAKQCKNFNNQTVRGIKERGEYFRRYGYKYTDYYKGGGLKN